MEVIDCRALRRRVAELRGEKTDEFEEIATKLGIEAREVKNMLKKDYEVKTDQKFLREQLEIESDVQTLKEFARIEKASRTDRDLDKCCPDTVAVIDKKVVGMELTAYPGNAEKNRLQNEICRVSDIVRDKLCQDFPELNGCYVSWMSNQVNILAKDSTGDFAIELLEFVKTENQKNPFAVGECRRFPEHRQQSSTRPATRPFKQGSLLDKHAQSVTVRRPSGNQSAAVSVPPSGFTSSFGTSIEILSAIIEGKESSRDKAFKKGIKEFWLLIHATRNPISSAIAPLHQHEIDRLLQSDAAEKARETQFRRVILWDGHHGGYVDLKNGDFCETTTNTKRRKKQ